MFKTNQHVSDTAERIEENIHNLPMTSIVLAGLLGAGIVALISTIGLLASHQKT